MEYRWNDADRRKPKCLEKNGTLPTTNPSWTELRLNTCLRGERQATDHLSHDTALNLLPPPELAPWNVHTAAYLLYRLPCHQTTSM